MGFPSNYHTVWVSEETKQRLAKLKENDTFNEVVTKLLELEEKYTETPIETYEYEYILNNNETKLFRVTFSENPKVEYFNRRKMEWESDIKAWFTGGRISDKELNNFIKFIIKPAHIILLYDMDEQMEINGVTIERV